MVDDAAPFITIGEFARQLKRSPTRVRQLVDRGQVVAVRTSDGQRLIPRAEVARVLALRAGQSTDDA